jgi:hypothetical protein
VDRAAADGDEIIPISIARQVRRPANLEQEKPKAARVMRSNPDQSSSACNRVNPGSRDERSWSIGRNNERVSADLAIDPLTKYLSGRTFMKWHAGCEARGQLAFTL